MRTSNARDVYPQPHRPPPSPFGDARGGHTTQPSGIAEQLWLSPSDAWEEKGRALRRLLNRALTANGISHEDLEEQTGYDEKQLGRALRDDGGAHVPLAVWACVLQLDRAGVLLPGIAAMLGYEVRRREPDLAAENRKLRTALNAAVEALREAAGGQP